FLVVRVPTIGLWDSCKGQDHRPDGLIFGHADLCWHLPPAKAVPTRDDQGQASSKRARGDRQCGLLAAKRWRSRCIAMLTGVADASLRFLFSDLCARAPVLLERSWCGAAGRRAVGPYGRPPSRMD